MQWFYTLCDRIRSLFRREAVIHDIDKELQLHLEMETESNMAKGMPADAARQAALKSFGNVNQVRDAAYEVRGGGRFETLLQDLRYGGRVLFKHKAFTLVAVLTLGIGIGANTAIFSVVNELLIRPLPYRDPERLVMVWEVTPEGRHQNTTSRANFRSWREQSQSFEKMAAFSDFRLNLTGEGDPEELSIQLATPELFQVLGTEPILGRTFLPEDGETGAPDVAVLSYGLWQRRFAGQASVVGKAITLNGAPVTVIGVLPPQFEWHIKNRSGTGRPAELWTILPMPTTAGANLRGRFLSVVARLKSGVSKEQAETEMKTIATYLSQDAPEYNKDYSAEVLPLREQFFGNVRRPLWVLLGAVGFVLLIACANVANLLLSLATAREKEIAVRAALGAGRWRIIRQLLTESVLLALLGSLLGLFLAWLGIKALIAISPGDLVNLQSVGLNLTVLTWTLVVSMLTGIVFGLAPAIQATRLSLNDTLKEGGKGEIGQVASSRRLRSFLVVAEVALALILLAGAGLLIKSFMQLRKIDRGFSADNVLTMVVPLSVSRYQEDQQFVDFFRQVLNRTRTLPGVKSAGIINYLPFYGGLGSSTGFKIEGRPQPPPGEEPGTDVRVADAGYFETMNIPLMRGRTFTDLEDKQARRVVLINEAMARQHFSGEDPIGKRIDVAMFDNPVITEIVGVVGDVRYDSLDEAPPAVYFPHPELTYAFMTLVIRTSGDPAAIAPAVQREIRALDPNQPVSDIRTMSQVLSDSLSRARFNTLLLALFAGLATLLSAIGIFGVMNYSVALRTREIGLRLALGAQPGHVLLLILKQGLLLTLLGVALGLAAALALTRLLQGLLFGVAATDPTTYAIMALLLVLVSLIACYVPAWRAMRLDPLLALRYE